MNESINHQKVSNPIGLIERYLCGCDDGQDKKCIGAFAILSFCLDRVRLLAIFASSELCDTKSQREGASRRS
jgi:hypothetical protein